MSVRNCSNCCKRRQPSFREQTIVNANDAEKIDSLIENNLHLLNDAQETLLHEAAKYGNVELAKRLIDTGSNVNAQDNLGKTPIMHAIVFDPFGCSKVFELLYKANADIYITDKCGKSAVNLVINDTNYPSEKIQKFFLELVHRECMNNSEMTAKKLISLRCPLRQVVLLGNPNVVEHMILNGIPVDSHHPGDPFTALAKAVQYMDLEMVKVLIKYGADVDLGDACEFIPIFHYGSFTSYRIQQPEIIQILLNKSTVLQDFNEENAIFQLETAFKYGNKEVIQILLDHHDDILNVRDAAQRTPFHYLSANIHSDITELLQDQNIDINVKDLGGRTPLFMAAECPRSHINTIRFLLENGADVNARTEFVEVPLFANGPP